MIVEYHRPSTIAQALLLLSRPDPKTYPLGGGSGLSRKRDEDFAVVDLQNLELENVEIFEDHLSIGATARLQKLIENDNSPLWLRNVCLRETSRNLREMSTVAGLLVGADGRSPLAIVLLAVGAKVVILPGVGTLPLESFFIERKLAKQPWLIKQLLLPSDVPVKFEFIARSPVDLPVLGVALAKWPSGEFRISVGGFGEAPVLVYEGKNPADAKYALGKAMLSSGDDWASSEYRQAASQEVLARLLKV